MILKTQTKVGLKTAVPGKEEKPPGSRYGLSGPALEAGTEMKNQDPGDYPPQAGGDLTPLPERDYESKGTPVNLTENQQPRICWVSVCGKRLEKVGFWT